MQRLIILLSLFATLNAEEAGHDPIVHWNRDPAESCEIFWLERSGQDGMEGKWASGLGGFGYGDDDDSTVFPGMKDRFLSIAIRRHVKLPAGKDIEFRISRKGGGTSDDFAFRMPPEDAGTVRFVTGGDVYHKRGAMDKMNRVAGAQDPLFALIGGDLAYANNASFDRWFDYVSSWARCARAPDGRLVPKVVAIGNHEITSHGYHPTDAPGPEAASMFYSLFVFPEVKNATHAVDFGDRLSILNLDSGHTKNIAAQNGWLEENLKGRAHVPNLFVCYHRPAYGVGAKPDAVDIQREWCPLFEKHRVTAVFENDHHVFSRSHPIKAGAIDEKEGVPYLGSGSWSVDVRRINPKEIETRPWIAHAEARNHLYLIETFPQGGYAATAKDIEGVEFDRSRREWKR